MVRQEVSPAPTLFSYLTNYGSAHLRMNDAAETCPLAMLRLVTAVAAHERVGPFEA